MNRLKKVILGLSIAFTMAIALVIGLVNMPKPTKLNNTPLSTLETNIEDKVYQVIDGGNALNYKYDNIQQATEDSTKVYSYYFKNTMPADMAVKMQELECDGLTFEYAVSNTEQTDTTSLTFSSTLSVEPLAPKGQSGSEIYVYVKVTATNSSVSFTTPIKWTFGYAQTITCYANGQPLGDPILGICNAGITNEVDLGTPEIPDGYELAGWYLDEELTTPATFPLSIQQTNSQLYAKLEEGYPEGNLPSDWLAWDSTNSYYVKKGTSTLPTELIIPKTYNDGTNGMANVTRIQYNAFQNSSVITSITIPNSLTEIVLSTFSGCTELQTVIFESESQIASIGNNAFKNCTKLTSIIIPASVTSIGNRVFTGCSVLTSITFEDPNNWYRVNTATNWMNKTGGTSTVVIDSSANATYLISTYLSYYWYKL